MSSIFNIFPIFTRENTSHLPKSKLLLKGITNRPRLSKYLNKWLWMKSLKNFKYLPAIIRVYRCQLKSFSIKTIKILKNIFSSLRIVITKRSCLKSISKSLYRWNYCDKKVTVPMALGHKCKTSYRQLVLRRGSVKMQLYGKSRSQMRPRWVFLLMVIFYQFHVSLFSSLIT